MAIRTTTTTTAGLVPLAAAAVLAGAFIAPSGATAATHICVGKGSGCVATIPAALAQAHNGDTIDIARGHFAGGFTIDKSVNLVGAGKFRTVIRGGGPVITIAAPSASSAPSSVSISRLAIEHGVAAQFGFHGSGGGIDIEPTDEGGLGATVTATDVIVRHNRATATTTSPFPSGVPCPDGDCPFAFAKGGGIFNGGNLTLIHSLVVDNAVEGRLSDAVGGGIYSQTGDLVVQRSVVADNAATPKKIGRFAEGGGFFVDSGTLELKDSVVTRNRADLVTSWPIQGQGVLIDMNANSGGIHIGDGVSASIKRAVVSDNVVSVDDPVGEPLAFDSGMLVGDSEISVTDTLFRHNAVRAMAATDADVGPSGTVVEVDGPATFERTFILGNTVHAKSTDGPAGATNGLAVFDFSNNPRQVTFSEGNISHNLARASSHQGATSRGGAVLNNSLLAVDHTLLSHNRVLVHNDGDVAQGGAIWNGVLLSGPPVVLTVDHSRIVRNSAQAGAGTAAGGGIFTTEPVTLTHTLLAHNHPDQCSGC